MPKGPVSKSKRQHKFVASKAAEGVKWAKDWLKKDKGWKSLPNRVKRRTEPNRGFQEPWDDAGVATLE